MRLGREFTRTDEKGRVVVPQRMREALGTQVIMTTGLFGELLCFSEEDFESYIADLLEKCSTEDDRWTISSTIGHPAETAEIKPNGRLTIPEQLRRDVKFAPHMDVALVWNRDGYLEIWKSDEYAEMRKSPADYKAKHRAPLRRMILRPTDRPLFERGA